MNKKNLDLIKAARLERASLSPQELAHTKFMVYHSLGDVCVCPAWAYQLDPVNELVETKSGWVLKKALLRVQFDRNNNVFQMSTEFKGSYDFMGTEKECVDYVVSQANKVAIGWIVEFEGKKRPYLIGKGLGIPAGRVGFYENEGGCIDSLVFLIINPEGFKRSPPHQFP